ncbi:MAG: RNA-binding S4 domain-containing protein [Armatimonadetes bacterium]|nr:RNA-binding S4 domain-containing protein [Armatimonadota bacterium]
MSPRSQAPAVRDVRISTETIELEQFLKWAQVVPSGGTAKQLIRCGRVRVNGEVERRRGRTLRSGDLVDVGAGVPVQGPAGVLRVMR